MYMIFVNDEYLYYELLELGLEEDKILKLFNKFKNFRIYIRDKFVRDIQFYKRYKYLKKSDILQTDIIKILSKEFELSKNRTRELIKKSEYHSTNSTLLKRN